MLTLCMLYLQIVSQLPGDPVHDYQERKPSFGTSSGFVRELYLLYVDINAPHLAAIGWHEE